MTKVLDELGTETLTKTNAVKPLKDYLGDIYEGLGDGSKEYLGIKTGFKSLDNATMGLSGLIVLSGRAGGGKTSLAIQLAYQACLANNAPIIFYSLEMSRRQVAVRLLSQLSGIDQKTIYRGGRQTDTLEQYSATKKDLEKLEATKAKLAEITDKFYVYDRTDGELDFSRLEDNIQTVKTETDSEQVFIVIDHLQVFTGNKEMQRYDQLSKENALINGFKDIQERTNATILLISQENKAEYNKGKVTAVKGSVDIIYLADLVMQIQGEEQDNGDNDAVYETFGKPAEEVKLRINKNRYGETKVVKLRFNGSTSSFTEL